MSTALKPVPGAHPIRRADVQAEVERFTHEALRAHGGTGRITVTMDFKDGQGISYRCSVEGARKDLTRPDHGA